MDGWLVGWMDGIVCSPASPASSDERKHADADSSHLH